MTFPISRLEHVPTSLAVCLEAERFQYAYGWLSNWPKCKIFALGVKGDVPKSLSMPSVTLAPGVHPWTVTHHDVPVVRNELEFLRTKVDDMKARYDTLRDFISGFMFPRFSVRTPITLLRKVVAQSIIPRCRALLTLQPIKLSDASSLDSLIAEKVHVALGFPFRPSSKLLSLPTSHLGLGFPSVYRINAGLLLNGLSRDLNHHIPAYRQMAALTLADWQCYYNGCIYPLDEHGLTRSFTGSYGRIPSTWIQAQSLLKTLQLSLRSTDSSSILTGDFSVSHALGVCRSAGLEIPNNHAVRALATRGIVQLRDAGRWVIGPEAAAVFDVPDIPPLVAQGWTPGAQRQWRQVSECLGQLRLRWLFSGDLALLVPRTIRQQYAEDYIRALPIWTFASRGPSLLPHGNRVWASDGSMSPASAIVTAPKNVTAAVAGAANIVVRVPGWNSSILHGELMGGVMSLLLCNPADSHIHADLLSLVNFVSDTRSGDKADDRLRYCNARSYFRWIQACVRRRPSTMVHHVKAHTDGRSLPSRLNAEADRLASSAQPAPVPSFLMNPYTFYAPQHGWIESNIQQFVDELLVRKTVQVLEHELYDPRPPPQYPYVPVLPTGDRLALCRYGCRTIDDEHHIFIECRRFHKLREEATVSVSRLTATRIDDTLGVGVHGDFGPLRTAAELLFSRDGSVWPLGSSTYYLGYLPPLDALLSAVRFDTVIAREKFLSGISKGLASRIFGLYQKERRDAEIKRTR
ncbi:hypothetical protein BDZ89DRAFT_1079046 [Hymenopellis radicata]|nr:hypothetical protein BDZ89DRAFT_1079046 [Hymenopellis radicata]